jgi:hypothetical protein
MTSENKLQQSEEIELLQSIFISDISIEHNDSYPTLTIYLKTDSSEESKIKLKLEVFLNKDYPSDSLFEYKVSDDNNRLISSQFEDLYKQISDLYEENKGFPIIFQVTEIIKDYCSELEKKIISNSLIHDTISNVTTSNTSHSNKLPSSIIEKSKGNLLENRKFTKVTKESYNEWFKKYIKEKEIEGGKELKKKKEIQLRVSGREYFIKNKNNLEQEDKQEGEDVDYNLNKDVNVDEDLFKDDGVDFGDVDFDEEEEEDDEDFEDGEYEEYEEFEEEEEEEEEEEKNKKGKNNKNSKNKK